MKQFGLSKSERIKRKKIFNLVYSEGTALYSNNNRFKAIYYIVENSEKPGIKTAFAVLAGGIPKNSHRSWMDVM